MAVRRVRATRARGVTRRRATWTRRGRIWSAASSASSQKHPRLKNTNNRVHLGTLGIGQPLHRGLSRRVPGRVVHAAQRIARRRQRHRLALHRAGAEGHAHVDDQPAEPRPRVFPGGHAALRRLRRGGGVGAELRAHESRMHDAERGERGACGDPEAVRESRGSGELSPQLREPREPLRREHPRDAQGRGACASRRARHHSGQHGCAFVHRARPRQ